MRIFVATALAVCMWTAVSAGQSKTLPGETVTIRATVEAIELASRALTLKRPDGTLTEVTVPESVEKLSAIKVGDVVMVRAYDTITIRKKAPGEAAVNTASGSVSKTGAATPGGTAARQRAITATVTALDRLVPSITFTGPNGWTYSSRVADKEALKQVEVGDRVDIIWTEAVTLSVVH